MSRPAKRPSPLTPEQQELVTWLFHGQKSMLPAVEYLDRRVTYLVTLAGISSEDADGICWVAACRAATRFRPPHTQDGYVPVGHMTGDLVEDNRKAFRWFAARACLFDLRRIAIRTLTRHQTYREISLNSRDQYGQAFADKIVDRKDTGEAVLRQDAYRFLDITLSRLPDAQQRVLREFYGIGTSRRTRAEIAASLSLTKQAVSLRVKAGLRQLQKKLQCADLW